MTYNVFGGTLNLTQPTVLLLCLSWRSSCVKVWCVNSRASAEPSSLRRFFSGVLLWNRPVDCESYVARVLSVVITVAICQQFVASFWVCTNLPYCENLSFSASFYSIISTQSCVLLDIPVLRSKMALWGKGAWPLSTASQGCLVGPRVL